MNKLKNLKQKIIYRSNYRGTKEMDILLSSFVRQNIDKLSENELNDLEKFLNYEDEIIYNFYQNNITNKDIKDNSVSEIFKKFKI
ncbi:MAG: succinate dehydrogenase assembly factor 2 [Pelagibacteraceae bacterium]